MQQKPYSLLFAHGAGADKDSPWMQSVAMLLKDAGVPVVRFNFPFMDKRLSDGKKYPPDKMDILIQTYKDIMEHHTDRPVFIGGKSMGARVASMIAPQYAHILGLVAFSYPFHPVGKPEKLRTQHLHSYNKPALILQGERDTMGNKTQWQGFDLDTNIHIHPIPSANHDLKPLVASGYTHQNALEMATHKAIEFMDSQYHQYVKAKVL